MKNCCQNSKAPHTDLLALRRSTSIHDLLNEIPNLDCVKEIIKFKDQQARNAICLARAIKKSERLRNAERNDNKWKRKKCQMALEQEDKKTKIM